MKTQLKALPLAIAMALTAITAPAAITTSIIYNSITGAAGITAWQNPYTVSSTGANPSGFNSAENNYGGSSLYSLGQSFQATSSGSLSDVQIMITGIAPVSFNVSLYDAGPVSTLSDNGSASYTPGSGGVSANLFTDTSTQTWTSYTQSGATAAILDFSLSGADQVSMNVGDEYIFEISSTSNPGNMSWLRMANNALDYANGQAFRQRGALNGNPARDMSLALQINAVPEPTTYALMGGGLALLGVIRRFRK